MAGFVDRILAQPSLSLGREEEVLLLDLKKGIGP
jgi:hypothetical protein